MNELMRRVTIFVCVVAASLFAATLEQLSLEEMIAKSTAIIRGQVENSYSTLRNGTVYTIYRVRVLERWKGEPSATIEVTVPGGVAGGVRQRFSGAPQLERGSEYLLFLWSGRSGSTQVIGLSQGVFDINRQPSGGATALRAATTETLLDPATQQPVRDPGLAMPLGEIVSRIQHKLGKAAQE